MLYILNTTILAPKADWGTICFKKIKKKTVKAIIKKYGKYTSVVGHQATADLLTKILNVEIKSNRENVNYESGDECVCFKLADRIPEGKVLTLDEIEKLTYCFYDIIY